MAFFPPAMALSRALVLGGGGYQLKISSPKTPNPIPKTKSSDPNPNPDSKFPTSIFLRPKHPSLRPGLHVAHRHPGWRAPPVARRPPDLRGARPPSSLPGFKKYPSGVRMVEWMKGHALVLWGGGFRGFLPESTTSTISEVRMFEPI